MIQTRNKQTQNINIEARNTKNKKLVQQQSSNDASSSLLFAAFEITEVQRRLAVQGKNILKVHRFDLIRPFNFLEWIHIQSAYM